MQGQTLYGVLSAAATATTYGVFTGTLTQQDSTHVTYVAPATVTAPHTIDGLQPLPGDSPFYTRIDNLPTQSSHFMGDGSGYCEQVAIHRCLGDPYAGTGQYAMVEPVATAVNAGPCDNINGGNYAMVPGANLPGGGLNDGYMASGCHVGSAPENAHAYITSQETVLYSPVTGTEPSPITISNVYGGTDTFPDVRLKWYEHRESGTWRIDVQPCNLTGTDAASPAFQNCPIGGTVPYSSGYDTSDQHEYIQSIDSTKTYENYGETSRFTGIACSGSDNSKSCGAGSGRSLSWSSYLGQSAMGLAGTPENQVELTEQDLVRAAVAGPTVAPIQHQFVFTLGINSTGGGAGDAGCGGAWDWPALGPSYNGQPLCENTATIPIMGARRRLSKTRTSMVSPVIKVNMVNFGSGYAPGQVLPITITGCTSIDGVHPASGIAFVGKGGSVLNDQYNGVFAFINNTGTNCSSPTASFPAPTGGGTTATATLTVLDSSKWANTNVAQAMYDQATNYGMSYDDTSSVQSPEFRMNGTGYKSSYAASVFQFYTGGNGFPSGNGAMFGNQLLWEEVDQSSMYPQGGSWPAPTTPYKDTTAMRGIWMADSANSYEGSQVHNQAIVKLTATSGGAVSYSPIPLLGVGVGMISGDVVLHLNIASGMTPYTIPYYVVGDPTNSGATFSIVTSPCSGSDSITAAGVYTTCPTFNGASIKTGVIKMTANANSNAFNYILVTVLPVDASGVIRLDLFGPGLANDGSGNSWAPDCCWQGPSLYVDDGRYPGWQNTAAKLGRSSAPLSVIGEHTVYETAGHDPDISMSFVVPNGNYKLRVLAPIGSNGQNTANNLGNRSFMSLQTQNGVVKYMTCAVCDTDNQFNMPVDYMVPNKVTNNLLFIGTRSTVWSRYKNQTPYNGGTGEIAGIAILPDSTSPYWEIGSYFPFEYRKGDTFTLTSLSDGVHTVQNSGGAPYPGLLQLYIRDWYTGVNDPVWSFVSGPGSVTSTGMYVAPTTAPNGNHCAVVKAVSASTPSISAQQTVCVVIPGTTTTYTLK